MQLMEREEEVQNLKSQVVDLKGRIRILRKDLELSREEICKTKEREGGWKDSMAQYKVTSRESQASSEAEFRNRILSLEEELKKQRERCITIIEEKEDEVNMLKSNMEAALEAAFRAAANTAAGRGSPMPNKSGSPSIRSFPSTPFHDQNDILETSQKLIAASIVESTNAISNHSTKLRVSCNRQRIRRSKSGSTGRDQVSISVKSYPIEF